LPNLIKFGLESNLIGFAKRSFYHYHSDLIRQVTPRRTEHKSGGQTGAAFLATALDDQPTGFGRHTGKKSDPTLTATVRRLKRSFHFLFLLC
jgi:hypothetical protein